MEHRACKHEVLSLTPSAIDARALSLLFNNQINFKKRGRERAAEGGRRGGGKTRTRPCLAGVPPPSHLGSLPGGGAYRDCPNLPGHCPPEGMSSLRLCSRAPHPASQTGKEKRKTKTKRQSTLPPQPVFKQAPVIHKWPRSSKTTRAVCTPRPGAGVSRPRMQSPRRAGCDPGRCGVPPGPRPQAPPPGAPRPLHGPGRGGAAAGGGGASGWLRAAGRVLLPSPALPSPALPSPQHRAAPPRSDALCSRAWLGAAGGRRGGGGRWRAAGREPGRAMAASERLCDLWLLYYKQVSRRPGSGSERTCGPRPPAPPPLPRGPSPGGPNLLRDAGRGQAWTPSPR